MKNQRTDIQTSLAAELGFPKAHYVAVERERRWLCREFPRDRVIRTEAITDLYVSGAKLRLREARPLDGRPPMLRLSRKEDVDAETRLITSIYLLEDEFALLAASLPGDRLTKLRHRLLPVQGIPLSVDEFQGDQGLVLAEAEVDTPEQVAGFPHARFRLTRSHERHPFRRGPPGQKRSSEK